MENRTLADALKKALDMEKKGRTFYKDAAAKSKNETVRKTFDFLADSEVLHIESIKKFCAGLKEKGESPQIDLDATKAKRAEGLNIFSRSISGLKDKVRPVDDEKEALEFAMGFEKSGYEYYDNMLKGAADANLIGLLKFLLTEESAHYKGLMSLHTYLTDSANWFMYEEGSFPQG